MGLPGTGPRALFQRTDKSVPATLSAAVPARRNLMTGPSIRSVMARPRTPPSEDRFRVLYEGSQRSLADMAANHSLLLNRIRKIRSNLVRMLKELNPREFSALESNYHGRIEDMDDEMFLACVQHLLEAAAPEPVAAPAATSAPPEAGPPPTASSTSPSGSQAEEYALSDGRPDFSRLLADLNSSMGKAKTPASSAKAPPISLDEDTPSPSSSTGQEPSSAEETIVPTRKDPPGPAPSSPSGETQSLASVLAEYMPDPAEEEDLEQISDEWLGDNSNEFPEPDPAEEFPDLDPEYDDDDPAAENATEPAATIVPVRPDRASDSVKSAPAVSPMPAQAYSRPSSSRSRKGTRKPKIDATPPYEVDPSICDERQATAFLAMAVSPRPMFTSAMAASSPGGAEMVDAWRISQYESGGRDVRFLGPKKKWSSYGHLVLPSDGLLADAGIDGGWWAQTLSKVSGSRLYEAAVLLDSVCETMTDWEISDSGQSMSAVCPTPRGMVGIVVILPPQEQEVWRDELPDRLSSMVSKSLDLIAVMCTSKTKEDAVATAAAQACASGQWALPCPVVAATTSDWDKGLENASPVAVPQ